MLIGGGLLFSACNKEKLSDRGSLDKKSASPGANLYVMPKDLGDAEDVTERVEAIWERYDNFIAGS